MVKTKHKLGKFNHIMNGMKFSVFYVYYLKKCFSYNIYQIFSAVTF